MSLKLALCYSYNRCYITGNAEMGIGILNTSNKYQSIRHALKKELLERDECCNIEFGWDKEYRLAILSIRGKKIISLIKSDYDDDFWKINIKLYNSILTTNKFIRNDHNEWCIKFKDYKLKTKNKKKLMMLMSIIIRLYFKTITRKLLTSLLNEDLAYKIIRLLEK